MKRFWFLLIFLFSFFMEAYTQKIDAEWVKKNYTKREVMIPMRDGTRLFTAIYEPVSGNNKHPILITRTPYKAGPYGQEMNSMLWNSWSNYSREGYILIIQDVRGRWMSEGQFVDIRPFNSKKKKKTDVDEASDAYDTVDWLIKHIKNNNGRVGFIGTSYPGFYAMMAALSNHPAVRAVCTGAPVTDWFMGDDIHHNGALMLTDAFHFLSGVGRPRPVPVMAQSSALPFYQTDEYSFFLKSGGIKNLTALLGDSIKFWNEVMLHPNYDSWWQARNVRPGCYNVKPAVLVVGGTFDAEDCYGTLGTYKTINRQSPQTRLNIIMGPWAHGKWNTSNVNSLGNIYFGGNTSDYYRNKVEFPFLNYYLKGEGVIDSFSKATVFFSGSNQWRRFTEWPSKQVVMTPLYLAEKGTLQFTAPVSESSYSEYISDPAHPVPYTDKIVRGRGTDYMTADQRFASFRPDVLTFETQPLSADLTLGGELIADLKVAISTTDADFVVKLIDVFPDDFSYNTAKKGDDPNIMGGYQMLVRGDVMRGRFRDSFETPKAFSPSLPATVSFQLNDIAHTFKKGHRLMVQVQSSWFPLVDMNPQQFVDIYHCNAEDFVKSTIRVFHQGNLASKIILPVLNNKF